MRLTTALWSMELYFGDSLFYGNIFMQAFFFYFFIVILTTIIFGINIQFFMIIIKNQVEI